MYARTSHERYVMRSMGLESSERKWTDLISLIAHEMFEFAFCILVKLVGQGVRVRESWAHTAFASAVDLVFEMTDL